MKNFPSEAQMEKSKDGSEAIRGGSIGLNRILNSFVERSGKDKKPCFHAVLVNAFTVITNVWDKTLYPSVGDLEKGFLTDINLFLEYLDTYLAHTWNHAFNSQKYCPVIVYFPDYSYLPKELKRPLTGKKGEVESWYKIFYNRHSSEVGLVKTLEHSKCYFVTAGPQGYPHKDLLNSFRAATARRDSLYTSGDPVGILTHMPMDLHLGYRLRNLHLIERYTGRFRPQSDFHYKLDKEGRVPFQAAVHAVVGDDDLVQSLVNHKVRREVLNISQEEKWINRNPSDVMKRLSEITNIPVSKLRHYDFD